MLPRLSELRLKAAPVHVGAPPTKKGSGEVLLNVLMGLGEDEWEHILKQIDDEDACDSIGRICMAGGVFLDDPSKTRTTTPIQRLCGKDATYDQLNKSLGWYKPFENLDGVLAWCERNADSPIAKGMAGVEVGRRARTYFKSICERRRDFLQAKDRAQELVEGWRAAQSEYRDLITRMASPRGAPATYANAKWMVVEDDDAFEFIPGSCSTLDRALTTDRALRVDLDPEFPSGHPVREAMRRTPVVMGAGPNDTRETFDAAAVVGYTEIAKIAVAADPHHLVHIRGSVDPMTGIQPFPPCKDYEEIAEVAVAFDGLNLSRVPGSTMSPNALVQEVHFDQVVEPVSNYTELAKLAALSKISSRKAFIYVPGSINATTGRQLRPPIDDYYAIAEVHIRRDPRSLRYVPGSHAMGQEFHAPRLEDYAALAKIAIAGNPNTFRMVPPDLPEYGDLEAFRDRVVAIENDPAKLGQVGPEDPNYVALARAAIERDSDAFLLVPRTLAAYDELEAFRDQVVAIRKDPSTFERVRQDVPGYARLLGLRDRVVSEKREREAARQ